MELMLFAFYIRVGPYEDLLQAPLEWLLPAIDEQLRSYCYRILFSNNQRGDECLQSMNSFQPLPRFPPTFYLGN